MFGGGEGLWDEPWTGWWGEDPPSPSGFSMLWCGPATNPSSDMDVWQVIELMSL